jgi:hypothetical protein
MPRWPETPTTWKPTETEVDVPGVGTFRALATFDHGEPEGTTRYDDRTHKRVQNLRTHWRVTLTDVTTGAEIETPYNQGSAYDKPPAAGDVLASLLMDASCSQNARDVDDFAADLGYEKPSEALAAFHACQETELKLRRMLGQRYQQAQDWGSEQ